jgi:putative FmdB family regulatory protein
MPIYEYACDTCGTFEVTQRITDRPLRRCPTCKGKIRKLISNTSFQLKGSGWYVTDYAGKDGAKKTEEGKPDSAATKDAKESSDASSSKSESKKSDKSESKPDSKKTESKAEASAA